MRQLTDHKVNGLNESLNIAVTDQPGQGGACHRYEITGFSVSKNPSASLNGTTECYQQLTILFQNGPVQEAGGVNGISQEALIAVVIDRLRSFQAGPYACKENACALTHFEEGLMWLQKRTLDRLRRGVEGTNAK